MTGSIKSLTKTLKLFNVKTLSSIQARKRRYEIRYCMKILLRLVTGKIIIDTLWLCLFLGGFTVYITLRTLKKKTNILHVEGR